MIHENPILTAVRGKGIFNAGKRAIKIIQSLGFSPKMTLDTLQKFCELLQEFGCRGTWTIPAVLVERYGKNLTHFQDQGIEFAIHGYRHIDYSGVPKDIQCDHLLSAREIFSSANIDVSGFRGPYLHAIDSTCLKNNGLIYDSSQAVYWPIAGSNPTESYQKALQFYGAEPISAHLSFPHLAESIIHIPYSLPDDEALVERLGCSLLERNKIWLSILKQTQNSGALFVLGLHPERFMICQEALRAVLEEASKLESFVWIGTLAEIAQWWQSFADTVVTVSDLDAHTVYLEINSAAKNPILARGVEISRPSQAVYDDYVMIEDSSCQISFDKRPFIGLHPDTSPETALFLRQSGYIVEESIHPQNFTCYFEPSELLNINSMELLSKIEESRQPLVRLSRWPLGNRSALAITGDIDALTSWDYLWRVMRK